jgi:hypothetical protein
MPFVIIPLTLITIASRELVQLPVAVSSILIKVALVHELALAPLQALAMVVSLDKLARVLRVADLIVAVATARDLPVAELALVERTVLHYKLALPVLDPVHPLTFIAEKVVLVNVNAKTFLIFYKIL